MGYFLFAYAILRCIPSKRIRVLILVLSITYFYILSFTSINNFNFGFKLNFIKFSFILWCFNFILLTYLGRIHVIPYYVIYAQYFSILYFTRRRGRSKSRDRSRQSRSQLARGRQSSSLPRPQQEAGDW